MALLDHKCHFVLAEFENLVSSLARIHLSPLEFSAARLGAARRPPLLPISLFLSPSRSTSDERFPICTSIFSLHSLGYYTPQRAPRIFPLAYTRRQLAAASSAVLLRLSTSRGWASELVQIPMRRQEQRKPITDSSCAIS